MRRRHVLRMAARVRDNAMACGFALAQWVALPRAERKRRRRAVKGAKPHPFFRQCKHGAQFLDHCDYCPGGNPDIYDQEGAP